MTIAQMLEQSGILSLLGMGIVFSFLLIMVICVTIMGNVFKALGAGKNATAPLGESSIQPEVKETGSVIAAIAAAVNQYNNDN
jgi:oxaloacetate decarboxylase gamma subunit